MNLTIKKEWYEAANLMTNPADKADFFDLVLSYFFDGKEPDAGHSKEVMMLFRLIQSYLDRRRREKEKRKERHNSEEPAAQGAAAERKASAARKTETKRFVKPTVEEIAAYIKEKGYNVDAVHFFNYYESNGWRVGKNPMKNWKACAANWENNKFGTGKENAGAGTVWGNEHEAAADYMDLM